MADRPIDVPGSERIARNAYRTLGLPGDAGWEAIEAAAGHADRETNWDVPWLGPITRTPAALGVARNRLREPDIRLRERLFWFHESVAEEAVRDLEPESIRLALEGWASTSIPTARHDAAIVALLAAIALDPRLKDREIWMRVFEEWQGVLTLEEYWLDFMRVESEGQFANPAPFSDVYDLRDRVLAMVSDIPVRIARTALLEDDLGTSRRAVDLLREVLPEKLFGELAGDLAARLGESTPQVAQHIEIDTSALPAWAQQLDWEENAGPHEPVDESQESEPADVDVAEEVPIEAETAEPEEAEAPEPDEEETNEDPAEPFPDEEVELQPAAMEDDTSVAKPRSILPRKYRESKKARFRMPQLRLPKITLPRIALPKPRLPKPSFPKPSLLSWGVLKPSLPSGLPSLKISATSIPSLFAPALKIPRAISVPAPREMPFSGLAISVVVATVLAFLLVPLAQDYQADAITPFEAIVEPQLSADPALLLIDQRLEETDGQLAEMLVQVATIDHEIELASEGVADYRALLDDYERRADYGLPVDRTAYRRVTRLHRGAVAEHEELIVSRDSATATLGRIIAVDAQLIQAYNDRLKK